MVSTILSKLGVLVFLGALNPALPWKQLPSCSDPYLKVDHYRVSTKYNTKKITIMADQTEKSIDVTPISPIQRRDSLEKHLQTRPEAKDLKDRHILLDTNAAP